MHKGYVRLYRKSLDSGLIRNHPAWILFTYCLLRATHQAFKAVIGNQEVILAPGQLIFGRRLASEETGLSEQQIRTALGTLATFKILTIKSTNRFSVITIINWDTYQKEAGQSSQQINQQSTNNQPHTITKEQKNTLSVDLYAHYLSTVKPEQKTRQRALSNMAHHLKTHKFDTLRIAVSNYAMIAGDREPRFRKDPANFFGRREPVFPDYLPENFQAPTTGSQPVEQEPLSEVLS